MSNSKALKSKIYEGWVRHRRFSPTQNAFKYNVFMMYVDLAELDEVLSLSPFWSKARFALAKFKRSDFLGDKSQPLDQAVRDYVEQNTHKRPKGPIRVLSNWRYFGFIINPITIYYCFDEFGTDLEVIVAEVNNTPWNERHAYVLPVNGAPTLNCSFDKSMHVSPFNPMNMRYQWFSNVPSSHLSVHLENWQALSNQQLEGHLSHTEQLREHKVLDATLVLKAKTINTKTLNWTLILYPFMTVKVISAIYWQALKLLCKRTPFYSHAQKNS